MDSERRENPQLTERLTHLTQWEKSEAVDAKLIACGETLKETITEVRWYKSEHSLSMKAEIAEVTVTAGAFAAWFAETEADLKACTKAKRIRYQ